MMRYVYLLSLVGLAQAGPLFEVVQKSATFDEEYFKSLENESPSLFESDIIITKSDGENSALASWTTKWPNGKVPFVLSSSFTGSQKQKIREAMGEIAEKTCVRFRDKTKNDEDYVVILKGTSTQCNSNVGKIGGEQQLRLGNECFNARKTILHELMHAIGFIHEQTRSDRDNFVTINEENVYPDLRHNFKKHQASELTFLDTKNAYDSIMHYSSTAFAINPKVPTIIPKVRGVRLGGENHRLSDIDVLRINRHYSCGSTKPQPSPKQPAAGIDWHRQDDGITWASDCDFEASRALQNVHSKGEDCGSLCNRDAECDHFAWNDYEGGTCWMKKGYSPKNVRRAQNVVCGFIHTKI